MQIFKISIKNKELVENFNFPSLHFKDKKTAEAVIASINAITEEGNELDWKCEVIQVMSQEDVLEQLLTDHV